MNTKIANTKATRSVLITTAAVGMLLFSFTTQSFGQKEPVEQKRATSRDGLTDTGFMTNPNLSDDLDGNEDEYFYKFHAAPGKLTVTLDVKANETNAGATLDLFGVNSKAIMSNLLAQGVDGGSERVSKSVNLAKAQDIIIRIKGLKYGSSASYPGIYKIVLEGPAADFKGTAPSDGAGADNKPAPAPTNETGQDTSPNAGPSDNKAQDKKSATTPPVEAGKDKKSGAVDRVIDKTKKESGKWLDLLEKVKTIKP